MNIKNIRMSPTTRYRTPSDSVAGLFKADVDRVECQAESPRVSQARGIRDAGGRGDKPVRILVVCERPQAARKIQNSLAMLGHEVLVARSGEEAWGHIVKEARHVVIADRALPDMDGLELLRMVRAHRRSCDTYNILVTAKLGREDRLEAFAAGADDILARPADPDLLAARLESVRRICSARDVLARENSELTMLAAIDELTGVMNRRRFHEELDRSFARSRSDASGPDLEPLSLVMIDVDRFKAYNDDFGHTAGDRVLCEVAGLLARAVRKQDLVARYGGEEFALLFPSTPVEAAMSIAEAIRESIERHAWPHRGVTASFGVSAAGGSTPTCDSLVRLADRALYASKQAGRNRVTLCLGA
ncbi:GGDEF domain-containing protein [Singulisphaera sp. PoT]|uniref:GGDEF domain-containing protein n=1 Tax=Singulisphaera sp. PoT TaxID=3411797 RepID=UPI003BF4A7AD